MFRLMNLRMLVISPPPPPITATTTSYTPSVEAGRSLVIHDGTSVHEFEECVFDKLKVSAS